MELRGRERGERMEAMLTPSHAALRFSLAIRLDRCPQRTRPRRPQSICDVAKHSRPKQGIGNPSAMYCLLDHHASLCGGSTLVPIQFQVGPGRG